MQPCNRIYYSIKFPLRLDYGQSPHAYVNQRLQIQLELLMMSGIPLETCSAFNERWNNKFYYKVASCWLFLLSHTTMHGSMNIKSNSLNYYYYASVFSSEGNTQHIQWANSGLLFTIDTKIVRKRAGAIGNNKPMGPDRISGEILKLGREAMIQCLARLLDMTINNGTLPADWKRAIVFPSHKGSDRSLITNYRPVSLTSVVCKQMEHVIASYLRQVWDEKMVIRWSTWIQAGIFL